MTSSAEDALKFLESLEGDLQPSDESKSNSDIPSQAPSFKQDENPATISTSSASPPKINDNKNPPKNNPDTAPQSQQPSSFSFGTFNSALKTYLKDENVQKAKENVSKNVTSIASAFISSFNVPPSLQIKCHISSPFNLGQDIRYTLQEIWGNATKGRWSFDYDYSENHKTLFSENWNELLSVIKSEIKHSESLSISVVIMEIKWGNEDKDSSKQHIRSSSSISNPDNPQELSSRPPLPSELKLEGYAFVIKVLDITESGMIYGRYCQDNLFGLLENAFEHCGRQFQSKYAK
eukprot:NODE_306_length_10184_cov_0.912246.p6 type:complete len:292 gc:universal NODE_306_length_10184_cov_0.912246:2912-3787(+)